MKISEIITEGISSVIFNDIQDLGYNDVEFSWVHEHGTTSRMLQNSTLLTNDMLNSLNVAAKNNNYTVVNPNKEVVTLKSNPDTKGIKLLGERIIAGLKMVPIRTASGKSKYVPNESLVVMPNTTRLSWAIDEFNRIDLYNNVNFGNFLLTINGN